MRLILLAHTLAHAYHAYRLRRHMPPVYLQKPAAAKSLGTRAHLREALFCKLLQQARLAHAHVPCARPGKEGDKTWGSSVLSCRGLSLVGKKARISGGG